MKTQNRRSATYSKVFEPEVWLNPDAKPEPKKVRVPVYVVVVIISRDGVDEYRDLFKTKEIVEAHERYSAWRRLISVKMDVGIDVGDCIEGRVSLYEESCDIPIHSEFLSNFCQFCMG